MSRTNIEVRITADTTEYQRALYRARYPFLTPISQRLPLRGTIAWDLAILNVRVRQLGRALVHDIPGASQVPWPEVGHRLTQYLEAIGIAYFIVLALVLVGYTVGRMVGLVN